MKKLRGDPFEGVLGAAPDLVEVIERLGRRLAR
jgi:hypothetical protein